MTCPLDGNRQCSLMLRTVAGDSSRKNLTSLGYISFQLIGILIVNYTILLPSEYTYFFSSAHAASSHLGAFGLIRFIECHWYCLLLRLIHTSQAEAGMLS